MTKEKIDPTREEKLAVLWAALKTLPNTYEVHVAIPGSPPMPRGFIGHDLPRCIAVVEAMHARYGHIYDPETLARWRAKLEAGNVPTV